MTPALAERAWPSLVDGRPLLAVPLGSVEQHGPHLPLDTDTRIAVAVAEGLAGRRSGLLVAPALGYGASGEHAGFPGTLSLGVAALEAVLVELVRSADDTASGVVFVCGHGGNAEPLRRAVHRLTGEGRAVLGWHTHVPGGDAHAGRTETSLLLALTPQLVDLSRARAGVTTPLAELAGQLRAHGVRAISPTGVLGDPAGASAEEGRTLLRRLIDDLEAAVSGWVEAWR